MKTFAMSAVAAAMALVGSTAMAQGTYSGSVGACPNGFCGTTTGCADGSCGVAGCPDGKCGLMGCPNGSCGVGVSQVRYGTAARYPQPARPQVAGVGYAAPAAQPYYGASSAACPGGKCPPASSVSRTTGYRPMPTTMNCANGRCTTVPASRPVYQAQRPVYQAPRYNFLGLGW